MGTDSKKLQKIIKKLKILEKISKKIWQIFQKFLKIF